MAEKLPAPPANLKYLETHEWARLEVDGKTVTVGITEFAVKELQDLVFMSLPKKGARLARGQRFGEIESVKAVSDLIAPVTGEVVDVNGALDRSLDDLAREPYGAGWMIKVAVEGGPAALEGLIDSEAYAKLTATHGGH